MAGEVLADELLLAGGSGQHRAAAVNDDHLGAEALRRAGGDVADPIQVEGRGDYGGDLIAVLDHRERGHQARNAVDPSDEVIAQREVARLQRILEIRAVRNVQSDHRRIAAAFHLAVMPDHRQHAYPWNVAGKIPQELIAILRRERHFGVDARRRVQQDARRIDHLALRGDAAACQVDDLAAGNGAAFDAGSFQPADAFHHQRRDRQQSDDYQAGTDAEKGLVAARFRLRRLRQDLRRLCLDVRHLCRPPDPGA